MRNQFPGYFRPKKSEFDDIWKRGLVIPDTNILLHLLRFRRETRDEIVKTLKAMQTQLWLPYQVGFEFSRRWMEVEEENRASYDRLKESIRAEEATLCKLFDSVGRFQIVDATSEKAKVTKFIDELCRSIEDAAKKRPSSEETEKILDEISTLFTGVVGQFPGAENIIAWKKEAAQRYELKIPPGFKDSKKDGDDKFGDYIIWKEMIDIAKSRNLPVLFLSDDRKEDWALLRSGQDKGPRPEIMQEFWELTGQRFYSYPLTRFLEQAKQYTKVIVSTAAIKDVEHQARRRRERLRQEEEMYKNLLHHAAELGFSRERRINTETSPLETLKAAALAAESNVLIEASKRYSSDLSALEAIRNAASVAEAGALMNASKQFPHSELGALEAFKNSMAPETNSAIEYANRLSQSDIDTLEAFRKSAATYTELNTTSELAKQLALIANDPITGKPRK
jgi:hypothetical protein